MPKSHLYRPKCISEMRRSNLWSLLNGIKKCFSVVYHWATNNLRSACLSIDLTWAEGASRRRCTHSIVNWWNTTPKHGSIPNPTLLLFLKMAANCLEPALVHTLISTKMNKFTTEFWTLVSYPSCVAGGVPVTDGGGIRASLPSSGGGIKDMISSWAIVLIWLLMMYAISRSSCCWGTRGTTSGMSSPGEWMKIQGQY